MNYEATTRSVTQRTATVNTLQTTVSVLYAEGVLHPLLTATDTAGYSRLMKFLHDTCVLKGDPSHFKSLSAR
jgi:hypothetical protein